MEKHRKIFISLLSAFVVFLSTGAVFAGRWRVKEEVPVKTGLANEIKAQKPPLEEKKEYYSPDGEYTLTVNNKSLPDKMVHQTFYITTQEDDTPIKIYEHESTQDNVITVPDNTFAPDNEMIFLTYNEDSVARYMVLCTDAEDIKESTKSVEITKLFEETYPDYVITDVTGWGSFRLIVVNTDTLDGKTGPSWWFDVTNFSFIRLSSRFN